MPLPNYWKSFLDAAPDAIFLVDEDGRIRYATSQAERLFGYQPDELIGEPVEIFLPEGYREKHVNYRRSYMQMPTIRPMSMRSTLRAVRKDGTDFPAHISLSPVETGSRVLVLASVRDITEIEEARAALERSEQRLRELIEQMPDAVAVHRNGKLVDVNSALLGYLGYDDADELIGTSLADLIHPDDLDMARKRLAKMVRTGQAVPPAEERFFRRDGSIITAEVHDRPVIYAGEPMFVTIGRDVSHKQKLLARAMQLDRKAAVGMLATGVAHEINNPLAYAKANVEFVRRSLKAASKTSRPNLDAEQLADMLDALEDTADGLERIDTIVSDLNTFTDDHGGGIAPIDVEEVLEASINLVFRQLDSRAHVVRELRKLPQVEPNRSQLAEVFINLLTNALLSIEEGDPEDNEVRIATACADNKVTVSVRDTGCGMSEQVLACVFDPFYSTRREGEGTGLGLTIAQNTLKQLGGGIELESTPGEGTCVTVWLPALEPKGLVELDEETQPMIF